MTTKGKDLDQFQEEIDIRKKHDVDNLIAKFKIEAESYKRRYDDVLADLNNFTSQSRWLDSLQETYIPGKAIEAKTKTGTAEAVPLGIGSDWHVFETVKPQEVNGKNTYNVKISETGVNNFFNGILAWTNIHRSAVKINQLVLALLGDHITNMLHEDQKTDNAGPVQEEVLFALRLICGGIDMLLENGDFDKITLVCCPGNHAREDRDVKRASGVAVHSYEYLMYKFMEDFIYAGEERLDFQVAQGYHNWLNVFGKELRFHHGDWVRYMGGIGGLTIPMNKAIKAWNVGRRADFDIFGHWHTTASPGLYYSNGSIVGFSPYSLMIKAEYEDPQQGYILVDSKRFITAINRIYVR